MLIKICKQLVAKPLLSKVGVSHERKIIPMDTQEFRYLRFRAIGNMEKAGFNGNWDGFPYEHFEDDRPGYGYRSFINKRAHFEHNSLLGIKGSIGDLPDAYLNKFIYPKDIVAPLNIQSSNIKWADLLTPENTDSRLKILAYPEQKSGDIEVLMRIDTKLIESADVEPSVRKALSRMIRMIDTGQILTCSMGCYAPGAEVLMRDGTYKKIEDTRRNDLVLTHSGNWSYVQDTTIHSYEGDMYKLRVSSLPSQQVMITPEHPVWAMKTRPLCACGCEERVSKVSNNWIDGHRARVLNNNKTYSESYLQEREEIIETLQEEKLEWIYAKDLEEGDYVSYPITREEIPAPHITPSKARLIGYFLAEGSYLKYKPKKGVAYKSAVAFSFGYTEKDKPFIEEVIRLCKQEWPEVESRVYTAKDYIHKHNRHKYIQNFNGCVEIRLHKRYIAQFFEYYCGEYAKHKRLPQEVLTWPKYLQMQLLGAYFNGDGTRISSGISANTISEDLAYQLSYLLKRLGIPHGFEVGNFDYLPNTVYTLSIRSKWQAVLEEFWCYEYEPKSRDMSACDIFNNHILMPIREIEKVSYKGPVYNLDVAGDHSFVASGFATHNTNVEYSTCSTCGNEARFSSEYCDCLNKRKGLISVVSANNIRDLLDKGILRVEWLKHIIASTNDVNEIIKGSSSRGVAVRNGELNHILSFFELSTVGTPAYTKAIALEKIAKQAGGDQEEFLRQVRYQLGDDVILDLYGLMQQEGKISLMCDIR